MFRHAVSLLLAVLLTSTLATNFAFAKQSDEAKLKQKIVAWGTNKTVSVKLKSGSKIDGRLADIKDISFAVQLVENGQVTTREINYSDVQNISAKGDTSGAKIAGWIVLGAAAAVGTLFLIGLALAD
ncbi:MAG TPA: hypothetical protein VFZ34_06485 [Blastocatellia bacterium]|nr:hypothetical protein [Blastocatellia bacterium]